MKTNRLVVATKTGCDRQEPSVVQDNLLLRWVLRQHLRQCRVFGQAGSPRTPSPRLQQRVLRAVDRLLCNLPGDCREAVVRCILEQQSVATVAARLAWTDTQVRLQVRRGLLLLCQELCRRGIEATPEFVVRLLRRDAQSVKLPSKVRTQAIRSCRTAIAAELPPRVAGLAADFLKNHRQ